MPSSTNTLNPTGATPTDPYTLSNDLGSTDPGLGASLIGVAPNGCFSSTNVQDALEEICAGGGGGGTPPASDVTIVDAGGYYTSGNVEGALQEVGSKLDALPADNVTLTDAGGYYTSTDVEGALQEVGLSIENINQALGDITASEVSITDAGGYYTSTDVEGALQEVGQAQGSPNGIATLDAFGKVPASQLAIPDPIYFDGTWDALTNTPDISVAPNEGATWIVNVAGNTNLGGITDWNLGDWAIYHDGSWFKVAASATSPVVSVNGYIGAVVLTKSDVGLGNVENTALSTWGGSANLITLGTVTSGTWNGTPIGVLYGGTGATNESDARDNLGLTIGSDVQPWSATLDALAAGTYTGATSITTLGTITTGSIPASLVTIVDAGGYYTSTDVEGALQELGAYFGTYTGSTSIVTLGTITTGVWNGTPIGDTYISSAATWNAKVGPSRTIGTTAPLYGGGDLSADRTLYITEADATHDGYLTQADWVTFASKVPQTRTINGYALTANVTLSKSDIGLSNVENTALSTWAGSTNLTTLGTVTTGTWQGSSISTTYTDAKVVSVTGTAGRTTSTGGANPQIDLATAGTAGVYGYPSSLTTDAYGRVTSVTAGSAPVASVTGTANRITIGGTATNPTVDIAATYVGQASITTLGTVTTGVWNGTAIPILYGGTGQTTKTAAFDALSPLTTLGDIIYGGAAGTGTRLAGNSTTTRQFLREVGTGAAATAPVWDTVTKTDVGLSNVENTALSTWAGSANITTLGTIASGTVPAALTSIVDVGGYYTGTNVEAALQEVGLSIANGAGGVRFNVTSGTFQEATLGNYLFDVRYVNTGTGATPGANISSLAKGNGNNSTGLAVTADVTASGQTAKGIVVTSGSTNAGTLIYGVDIAAASSGNTGTATGLRSVVTGTSSTNVGIATSVTVNTAATTNTGVSVAVSGVSTNVGETITVTGAATTNTGLTVSASGATTNYSALFTAGNVGVGTSTPAQLLTVQNGNLLLTNNNNTAAELRLAEPSTGGSNYTAFKATTQAADITYTLPAALPAAQASGTSFGNAILETTSGGVQSWRQQSIAVTASLNFNNTANQTSSDLTITVTGAAVGDCVSLGVDPAAVIANTCYTAWVSAADTVTVRFNNYGTTSQNPAAGTFKVIVTK